MININNLNFIQEPFESKFISIWKADIFKSNICIKIYEDEQKMIIDHFVGDSSFTIPFVNYVEVYHLFKDSSFPTHYKSDIEKSLYLASIIIEAFSLNV